MTVLGVDACPSGWITGVSDDTELYVAQYDDVETLWAEHDDAERVLIDVPIGLPETGRRACDEAARELLGDRRSCVFYVPPRRVLDAGSYEAANERHRELTGHGLSIQTYNIIPVIEEVGTFLDEHEAARERVIECHPELCFAAFAGGDPVPDSKHTETGRKTRRELLREELPGSEQAYEDAMERFYRKDVGRDDVLDALALTAAAREESLLSVPEGRDHRIERGTIAYPEPR
ncbi:DUF429 domain-containing protein [Natranaeroarchaeum sulfidigenes]|uniref:Putative nuclease, RNAse H fold n=1 Tax=Natranaeroarchaeum sulfidigenes TaxID=2784880 RepID=A0A897MXC8_9EURY|nr:DUF429 domain-containing protein [Natranaeroarchaeum sulfidigenes]QSG03569.1 putative nuclease, RNAse H fold [Natranaeroarchaeum sulfidigenes]